MGLSANELRIGNLISYFNNDVLKVSAVFENGIHDEQYNGYEYNDIHPILLTDEWLSKCGFAKEDENNFILHQNNIYFRVHRNLISGEFMCKLVNNYSFLIKSVHNLQNLYFSITNVELTVA